MSPEPEDAVQPSYEGKDRSPAGILAGHEKLVSRLYQESDASSYSLSFEQFAAIVREVAEGYAARDAPPERAKDVKSLLESLRINDLALARGCLAGNEKAWETLLLRYRQPLYEIASAIAKDDNTGKELADSLYADLFGLTTRGEQRASKLKSYTGVGTLIGWLRTVLAQSFIDRYRREQRLVSLDSEEEDGAPASLLKQQTIDPQPLTDTRLDAAIDAALAAMKEEDRFILASYYLDDRKLADIAELLGVHESTISRRVEKIAARLRKHIRIGLMKRGMNPKEVEDAFSADVRTLQVNVAGRLKENLQENGPKSFSRQGTSGSSPK